MYVIHSVYVNWAGAEVILFDYDYFLTDNLHVIGTWVLMLAFITTILL